MRYLPHVKTKPSGAAWLGDVPEHWTMKRGRFCMQVNPRADRLTTLQSDDEVSFTPMEAVGEYGGLNLELTRHVGDASAGYTEFQDGDVVVAKITPCFENGKGALADGLLNGTAFGTTELHVLRVLPCLERRFLFYLTISSAYRKLGEADMYGAGGQKRVPPEYAKDFPTPVPPLIEQRAIADFLDQQTATVDTLVAKKRELVEKLKEKRSALISRTVTRGLPPEAACAAGLDPHPALQPSGYDWLGDVPEHWDVKRLKWSTAGCLNGIWGEEPNGTDDIICIRVADFDRDQFLVHGQPPTLRAVDPSQRRHRLLRNGDLLIEKSGGGEKQLVGCVVYFSHEFEAVCSNFVARMPVAPGMHPRFWSYVHAALYAGRLNYLAIKQTTGIQNLDTSAYLNLLVGYPPHEEQRAIADFLDQQTAKIDGMLLKVDEAINRLQEYRAALITSAVTGKIDVRSASRAHNATDEKEQISALA